MNTGERVVAIVLSYNGLEDTRKCLASLAAALRPYVLPILVDNGSSDGTTEAIRAEFPWCRVLRIEANRGPVAGNNAGLLAALETDAEWIVLLNNDIVVDATLFDRLLEAARCHPDYAVIGPVIKFMDDPDVVMTDGTVFNSPESKGFFVRKVVDLTGDRPPQITDVDIVNGCCLMIRADMVRRIGLFDETFFMYHDETDLCLRVADAGGKAGVIDHALIWHKGSATSQLTGKHTIRYFDARNLLYVLRKHRGAPRNGRARWRTAGAYFRYMYYLYCAMREAGNDRSATAILEGVYDGLIGRRGPYAAHRRLLAPIRWGFELVRRRPRTTPRQMPRPHTS